MSDSYIVDVRLRYRAEIGEYEPRVVTTVFGM
jgi:hypothetical protein